MSKIKILTFKRKYEGNFLVYKLKLLQKLTVLTPKYLK